MSEFTETTEVSYETDGMDAEFKAELDIKCKECTNEGRSLENIQCDKEELLTSV